MLSRLFVLLTARSAGEFLHAVRVSTKLGDEDAYCPCKGLSGLLACEVPAITHHLPRSAAHEEAHHRTRAARIERVELRGHVLHRRLDRLVPMMTGVLVDLSMDSRQQSSSYQRLILIPVREQPWHPLRKLIDVLRHLTDVYASADPLGEFTHQRLLGWEMSIDRGHGDAGPLSCSGKRELLKSFVQELLGSRLENPLVRSLLLLGAKRAVVGIGFALDRLTHVIPIYFMLLVITSCKQP